ncbi:mitochondrial fission factor-like isoform X3 [Thunnus albacares]|uniref:mitochondrial fission factor-like isoform X3 n=1 Tax=Thunnus albacares TaxID=8236 RepID=UPI001CF6D1F1|nr:mitochondrial fission factor-like isoform X3 [Thunnus albacares]
MCLRHPEDEDILEDLIELTEEMSQVPVRDPAFMEAINKNMRVPERLSVGTGRQWLEEEGEQPMDPPPAYTMQVPDRLTYTEAPDMSPRPLFTPSKPTICGPLGLEPCWECLSGEVFYREALQSPIRRSYSDQSFGRTPPGTPTQLKQALALPRHPSNSRGSDRPLHQYSAASLSAQTTSPQAQAQPFPATPVSLLSPQSMLQTAKQLGLQAFQHLLQTVSHKYRAMENWSLEEEGGAAVEFIVLRRQVMKMSRRLAALERHNTERRNTEVVLFSLLFSACLLNMWLWIRR